MSASSSSTSEKIAARCVHFGTCGGCSLQNLPYEAQLAKKAAAVRAALSAALPGLPLPELKVNASPEQWNYRNKMEFSFGDVYPPKPEGPTLKLGLKPKGRWYHILDLQECHLPSPEATQLLVAVRRWAEENKVAPYNAHKQVGLLRHLVVREAKNAPERMIVLVTEAGDIPEESFVKAVLSAYPATSILRGVNTKVSDTAISDRLKVLHGTGEIHEKLTVGGAALSFRISPHSFFQTNTRAAERLYGRLWEWAAELGAKRALDLYCGGGGITLCLAVGREKVYGAENNPSAVADAKANAALNGIAHAEFFCGDVALLLPSLLALKADVIVVDPPRAGLMPKVAQALADQCRKPLLYVSCNPEALTRDLRILSSAYRVAKTEAFDLFPHTEHVETAVLLLPH